MGKTIKLTYEYVRDFFKDNNCEMLDSDYKNARIHINYRCSCGNVAKIIFDSFRRGHRCNKCAVKKRLKKQTLSYEHVKKYFQEFGCELLEEEYINAKIKMRYICKCGDISRINFNNFHTGRRCKKCGLDQRSGENHYEWMEDRKKHDDGKKIRDKCYKMLKYTLNKTCQNKVSSTYNMLGYNSKELQNHIYKHSNWDILKNSNWHLDHIFPIKAFLDYGIKDMKLINCLDNLQPLSAEENLKKNDGYDELKFEKWLEIKVYEIRK